MSRTSPGAAQSSRSVASSSRARSSTPASVTWRCSRTRTGTRSCSTAATPPATDVTPNRRARPVPSPLLADFARIREQFDVHPDFPEAVEEAAHAAAERRIAGDGRADLRGLAFFTVDPAGSMDLDQAMLLERTPGGGYRVRYAIADVAQFVDRGGP